MAGTTPEKNPFERWKDGIRTAPSEPAWNTWDCEIQTVVNEYNRHLAGSTGYMSLDWQMIKAMAWVETGAAHSEWKIKPLQIGVMGDPGLKALLSDQEGGEMIIPSAWKDDLTEAKARTMATHNIRAGVGYLLMRMAHFDFHSITQPDAPVQEITVKSGDSFAKIAAANASTIEAMTALNPGIKTLQPKQILKYQKASIQRVITGWRQITTTQIAARYNGGGDPNYEKKLDFALSLIRQGTPQTCTPP